MSLITITPPAEEPISLALARLQCRVDGNEVDDLLTLYIAAAREECEKRTGRLLITRTVEQRLDAFPCGGAAIRLEGLPAGSIVSVKYDDANGTEQTLANDAYLLDAAAYPGGWLLPAAGSSWPATAPTVNCVRIRYQAGYGAAAQVPPSIRKWLLLAIGAAHENPSPITESSRAAALPERFHERLLDPFIVY